MSTTTTTAATLFDHLKMENFNDTEILEDEFMKIICALTQQHIDDQQEEKKSRVSRPTNEEEWRALCLVRWPSIEHIRAHDPSLKMMIKPPQTWEELYECLDDHQERQLRYAVAMRVAQPTVNARFNERNVGTANERIPLGVGKTHAVALMPDERTRQLRFYVCQVMSRSNDMATATMAGERMAELYQKYNESEAMENVVHFRALPMFSEPVPQMKREIQSSVTENTLCMRWGDNGLTWLVANIPYLTDQYLLLDFATETQFLNGIMYEDRLELYAIQGTTKVVRISIPGLEKLFSQTHRRIAVPATTTDSVVFESPIVITATHLCAQEGGVAIFSVGTAAGDIYQCSSSSEMLNGGKSVTSWPTPEEELQQLAKKSTVYKSPPREAIRSIHVVPGSGGQQFICSTDHNSAISVKLSEPMLCIRDHDYVIDSGIAGQVAIFLTETRVIYSTTVGKNAGDSLRVYPLERLAGMLGVVVGDMPQRRRNYKAFCCAIGRTEVLLPNCSLLRMTSSSAEAVSEFHQNVAQLNEFVRADKQQQQQQG